MTQSKGARPRVAPIAIITDDEMRARWKAGDPFAEIAQKAYQQRKLGRVAVRQIIFGGSGE